MKKIFAAVMLALFLTGCGAGESNAEPSASAESSIPEIMIPLEMPDIDISIPENYEKTSTENNSTVYIKEDASIIVNSDVFTENYRTLSEYVDYAVETYRNYSDKVDILNQEEYNGGELLEFIYSLNTENGVFSKYCMTAYFSDGEQVYLVTCKADVDTYESFRDEFLSVMDSVNLK